ncbi:hypothetical protein PCANC_28636 [Puccinia coronata f. sp. avenae]|uniref:Uncharacterized protein n=1 Tax=Puccinia coronata f. sp. avenae TaxID=200324 RepID=A0A2N5UET4_9BASI|nr:hypothetical protein PCANC_28636 [Puccinia coronata f. sp. avenae]PLW36238.1 hypothetical protein PCASD_12066 [Puccinia coronata f. sp. avenae]
MANCSPGSNNNNIQVTQPPGQELSLSHGAAPTTGTTTSNQTEIESLASQTPAPAKSVHQRHVGCLWMPTGFWATRSPMGGPWAAHFINGFRLGSTLANFSPARPAH